MSLRRTPFHEDRFNDYLDALVSGSSTPDTSDAAAAPNAGQPVPTDAAREIHDLARAADSRQGGPPDFIWESIMNTGTAATHPSLPSASPWPRPSTRTNPSFRPETRFAPPAARPSAHGASRKRIDRWVNAIAAIVLLLGIGAGWYFSGIGPGGPNGGNDEGRYAALPALQTGTPEALTPAELPDPEDCTVEPLSVDDVIAIVENPTTKLIELGIPYGPSDPDALIELQTQWQFYTPDEDSYAPPEQATYQEIEAAANQYLVCEKWGTNFQLWALESPEAVQSMILNRFQVYRSEQDVRSFVETHGPMTRAETVGGDINPGDGFISLASPERTDSSVTTHQDNPVTYAFVGTYTYRLEDGALMTMESWNGEVFVITEAEETGARYSYALVLVHYPEADVWLIDGVFSTRG